MSACVPSSESISSLEVAHKTVEVADDVSIRLAYKDFYIIRAGACDYTGLRVWPGAELLAKFVHAAGSAGALRPDHCVCELGAGVGLSGLVAARYARHVVLTDRVPVLLDLMSENIAANDLTKKASVFNLDWSEEGARQLMRTYSTPTPGSTSTDTTSSSTTAAAATPSSSEWTPAQACVIAADVVYPDTSDEALVALFQTVDVLLGDRSRSNAAAVPEPVSSSSFPTGLTGAFVCSYFSRDADTTKRLLLAADTAGFDAEPVERSAYLAQEDLEESEGRLQGLVVLFRRRSGDGAATELVDGLPRSLSHPALKRLWSPPMSRAAAAVEELASVDEGNAFAGMTVGDED